MRFQAQRSRHATPRMEFPTESFRTRARAPTTRLRSSAKRTPGRRPIPTAGHRRKRITYPGLMDLLIFPRGTYHYYDGVLQGNYKEPQKYYRYFPYPNNSHCGPYPAAGPFARPQGPAIVGEDLFAALVNWVENG